MSSRSKGFTIIELMLTVVLITVALLGIMRLFSNAARGGLQADVTVIATNLAKEKLEIIISHKVANGYVNLNGANYPNENFSGDYSTFTRSTSITEVASVDFVTPSPGSGYKRIDVTTSWGTSASERVVLSTILADY